MQRQRKERDENKEKDKLSRKRAFPEDYLEEEPDEIEAKEKGIQILFPTKL